MTDGKKVIATRMIEANLDLYVSFYDHAWAQELGERALLNSLRRWRSCA